DYPPSSAVNGLQHLDRRTLDDLMFQAPTCTSSQNARVPAHPASRAGLARDFEAERRRKEWPTFFWETKKGWATLATSRVC
ncbi:MAG: hypothetical protein DMG40_27775, partial [Acidobacteria bacterium]